MAECILMKSGSVTSSSDCTATKDKVLVGCTAITNDSNDEAVAGTMADKSGTTQSATASLDSANSRVQMTVPTTGKYSTTSKLYTTYATIRNLINLTATKIATGNTILGLAGTYKGLGDAGTSHVLNGKKFSTANLSNATGTMPNRGAVTRSLNPGGSYSIVNGYHDGSGKITAKAKNVKMLGVCVFRGFGAPANEYFPFEEASFTMPADGTVYYGGGSASYASKGTVVCEIYNNGAVFDNRNIDSSNSYTVRGTMFDKSFSVSKGDVVTLKASVTSGTHLIAMMQAVIVYFT